MIIGTVKKISYSKEDGCYFDWLANGSEMSKRFSIDELPDYLQYVLKPGVSLGITLSKASNRVWSLV